MSIVDTTPTTPDANGLVGMTPMARRLITIRLNYEPPPTAKIGPFKESLSIEKPTLNEIRGILINFVSQVRVIKWIKEAARKITNKRNPTEFKL